MREVDAGDFFWHGAFWVWADEVLLRGVARGWRKDLQELTQGRWGGMLWYGRGWSLFLVAGFGCEIGRYKNDFIRAWVAG
jgi:hypothetical protein